jgi:hypothetical protein
MSRRRRISPADTPFARHWPPPAAAAAADTPLRQPLLIFASTRHASHDADGHAADISRDAFIIFSR